MSTGSDGNAGSAFKAASRVLARSLGIDVDHRSRTEPTAALQGVAARVPSLDSPSDLFFEREPTVAEWLRAHTPTRAHARTYLGELFPFWTWIFNYNLTWLTGDLVAGITVGFVVIPQGMAYALLAQLSPEYGLYTSFIGFLLYWAFATSKDITIGTVAVMSQLVGNIVIRVQGEYPHLAAPDIARSVSLVAGAILLSIGLLRIGWVVEFIPLVAISSFMTGAAINIAAGQVPNLMGIKGVNTRGATHVAILQTLRALPNTKPDAALGLTALFALYAIRWGCDAMSRRQPAKKKLWFLVSTLRMAFVILLYILVSYLANRRIPDAAKAPFKILGDVPSGFKHTGVPNISTDMIGAFAPDLPATIIVLIIEHIAISKSFGRVNNYVINPSQELVAVGFTNIIGPFLGAYPATGSFSRTAIKSKAGVRTPLAGLFTAAIVLLAIYALTHMFYYIPMASLAAIIIHAVGDLISPPSTVYRFWELSPIEAFVFFGGVILAVFSSIENGIYLTVAASAALLLYRTARAKGAFLGHVPIHRAHVHARASDAGSRAEDHHPSASPSREAFLPLDHSDGSNPNLQIQQPYPGVFIFRFREGFNYLNQAYYLDQLVRHVMHDTRRTRTDDSHAKPGDRPWNDPGPRHRTTPEDLQPDTRPMLRAVILDMSSTTSLDVTSVQGLVDIRNQLDRHATPGLVEWHFAHVSNRWARRALGVAGFGFPTPEGVSVWRPIFSIAGAAEEAADGLAGPGGGASKAATSIEGPRDEETGKVEVDRRREFATSRGGRMVPISGLDRPFFHVDVAAALESALADVVI